MSRAVFPTLVRQIVRSLARIEREEICCGDITLQQYDTLRLIHDRGALSTGDVATTVGIDLSTASRNLAVLEKNGYVARARSETDARQIVNKLTRKGSRCIESLRCDERSVYDTLYDRIPAAKRAAVLDALAVLADAVGDNSEPSSACCSPRSAPNEERSRP